MAKLIVAAIPEEPQSFEDWVDDDGLGHGPYKMKLTIWREGEHAYFDWSGTDPQAMGPVNFYLSEAMFKMFIGVYLIMVFDPQILFNDGFYPLLHIVIPDGCLLHPKFPSALGCRTHALTRLFDILGGALARKSPEHTTAAGYGTSPYMLYSGWDGAGEFYYLMEISYGGIPGRPIGDGMDGHSWWPLFQNIPTEYLEAYYPVRIDGYTTITDSGGAGMHRGGNGIEKRYVYLEPGEVSIHDDRWLTYPWGILGGKPGTQVGEDPRAQGRHARAAAVEVRRGQGRARRHARLPHGGWRRLEGPVRPAGREGGGRRREGTRLGREGEGGLRRRRRRRRRRPRSCASDCAEERGDVLDFDMGPPLEEILARAKEETGPRAAGAAGAARVGADGVGRGCASPRSRARRPPDDGRRPE